MSERNQSEQKNYFDPKDEKIQKEILMMITQYLDETGFRSSAQILSDEAKINSSKDSNRKQEMNSLKASLKAGDWTQIESLQLDKTQSPRFIYQLYRYHFLELVVSGDAHAALQFLSSRLRPYKAFEDPTGDFDSLCLLLVDSASTSGIETPPNLAEALDKLLSLVDTSLESITYNSSQRSDTIPKGRLVRLMQQAVSLQLSCYPRGAVKSIVNNFKPAILPSCVPKSLPVEHKGPIKTISVIPGTDTFISGGADSNVIVWDLKRKMKSCVLKGHTGRVWSVVAKKPTVAASSGGDGTIRIWNLQSRETRYTIQDFTNDVYAVDMDSSGAKLISGGFDRTFCLYDIESGKPVFKKQGHLASITSVLFDPSGNMAITGGKDLAIKIWDIRNALVVRVLAPVLSEVTSVHADRSFSYILGSTKNSTIRLWDMRMSEAVNLLRGHSNTSKHFVRACFGPDDRTVLSGSDDGKIYVFGATSGNILESFPAHPKGSYGMVYCESMRQFISYGEDNLIQVWDEKSN
ncbi:hypothetical protein TVAG_477020 [Trichomonas vaginalis G3]|uniref:WD40 repeat-containing protein SMU1 n=1 Tax=Trichomonas vaginalis (strain ATCC PRA-98 / G3) TaxID=412133 RepID=A2DAC5_TRIV3|nr:repeat protein-related family [Trichomonas vaginalis G3]EAY22773.1 hypothetical protein TVAG_477020 [Trichomonas vaginalis G3]KAI5525584.1 repeat protein-related family [Trichomonas vaginalis G3]|eukprot:XP_001583759.1 hypothetical protein [Trichomonas vaginalis G3]